jgi:hypothetical protein
MVAWVAHGYKTPTLMGISFVHKAQDTSGTPVPQNQKINWKGMHGNFSMNLHCLYDSSIKAKMWHFAKK